MILSKLQHRLQNQQQTKRLERCGLYEKYKKQAAKQLNGGYTLEELLVVIAIMAVMIGGSAVGISVNTGGNVKKAGNYVYTQLNSLRSQTLTVNADWRLEIEKDSDDTYRIVTYKDNNNKDDSITSDVAWWFNLNIYYDKDSIVAYGYMMHPSDYDDIRVQITEYLNDLFKNA